MLYTLTLLVFFLWFLFPADAVKERVEADLGRVTPGLTWSIGKIGLAFPLDIRFTDINVRKNGRKKKDIVFKVDSLSLRPDVMTWQQSGNWSAWYQMKMLAGGEIKGGFQLTQEHTILQYTAEVQGIKLDNPELKNFFQQYGRTLSGQFLGNFTGSWDLRQGKSADLTGLVRINKGKISLQESVLGMEELAFEQVSSKIKYHSKRLHINDGKMKSRQLGAEFNGTLRAHPTIFYLSWLQLKGSLIPRSEFMTSIGDARLQSVLKRQLKEGKMPFKVTGALKEPGIVFTGLPADFSRRLRKRGR